MIESEESLKKRQEIEKNQSLKENQIFMKEKIQLMKRTATISIDRSDEIKQIEQWTNTTFDKVLFDTECCNWDVNTSTFIEHVKGYDNNVFVIEDTNGNVFGGFLSVKNEFNEVRYDDHYWIDGIKDEETFVFSLKSNNRLPGPMKFSIIPSQIERCFHPEREDEGQLFGIGKGDIIIGKKINQKKCWVKQTTFDYQGYTRALTGTEGLHEEFEVKRVQVWHMKLTEEQRKQKEEKQQLKEQMRMNIFNEELCQLNILSNNIVNEFRNEIEQIEEWSELKYKEIIFDS